MFDFQLIIEDNVTPFVEKLEQGMNDLEPLVKEMLEQWRNVEQHAIFEAHERGKTSPAGHEAWKALSASYLESNKKRNSQHPTDIMQLTGGLREDLTTGTSHTVEALTSTTGQAQILFGTTREYAIYAGGGNGDSRAVMYVTPEAIQHYEALANHFLSELIVAVRESTARAYGV
jgi:hypothetical protein